ncbi:HEAT repeat domain-containing protein [Altericista sp. CCNU0014]|uniref:HEAT repeat domain-containing protein n=1 Tax=Altericista sp. CCNU0014 TaxID=3082949 RepID=UPI00384AA9C8
MQLDEVKALLDSENPQKRMSAIVALRQYEETIAVPLLVSQLNDSEFIIRSFAAIGLGHKQTPQGFEVLVDVLQHDRDANVRSEAANSLARYGKQALPHLMKAAEADDHWLLQLSVLPVVAELNCPDELYILCMRALEHSDPVVQCLGLEHLGYLEGSARHDDALETLLIWAESENWLLRKQVALTLRQFKGLFSQNALLRLRQDDDYRVVAATLEGLISI